ncbi:hypothetical protein [Thioalkalivibrio thiocyanodenitrificans]|uniref:hypothetical protein n=1 Tax=Thioalkalivibrio thiocyanodenitrificans TaxID=243063 RepID=UPI0003827365|nr:hypothetical protein [Thioalkalivibrio thiocyanodenitrificans]
MSAREIERLVEAESQRSDKSTWDGGDKVCEECGNEKMVWVQRGKARIERCHLCGTYRMSHRYPATPLTTINQATGLYSVGFIEPVKEANGTRHMLRPIHDLAKFIEAIPRIASREDVWYAWYSARDPSGKWQKYNIKGTRFPCPDEPDPRQESCG